MSKKFGVVICEYCGEEIEYCGITSGEEYEAHLKEECEGAEK